MDKAGGAKRRLFVAVPLPEDLIGFVREAQGMLPRLPGLRLMGEAQLHVTLAFIGEVGEREANAARAVVGSVPADMGGDVLLGGFLLLPSAMRARVVALEVTDEAGVFAGLFGQVMDGLEDVGVMQREKRPFRPHLTVARLRNPGSLQPRFQSGQVEFTVESVCLFESELRREGAVYTVLERKVFVRSGGQETV
jgi:RNA 2',3'-cyclic 3'-phosphodiesterase